MPKFRTAYRSSAMPKPNVKARHNLPNFAFTEKAGLTFGWIATAVGSFFWILDQLGRLATFRSVLPSALIPWIAPGLIALGIALFVWSVFGVETRPELYGPGDVLLTGSIKKRILLYVPLAILSGVFLAAVVVVVPIALQKYFPAVATVSTTSAEVPSRFHRIDKPPETDGAASAATHASPSRSLGVTLVQSSLPKPESFVQLEELKVIKESAFQIGKPILVNIIYKNRGREPVSGLRLFEAMILCSAPGDQRSKDRGTWHLFQDAVAREKASNDEMGVDVGVDRRVFGTVYSQPMTKSLISSILSRNTLVYVLSHAEWNENPKGIDLCQWMQIPSDINGLRIPNDRIVWDACELPAPKRKDTVSGQQQAPAKTAPTVLVYGESENSVFSHIQNCWGGTAIQVGDSKKDHFSNVKSGGCLGSEQQQNQNKNRHTQSRWPSRRICPAESTLSCHPVRNNSMQPAP